MGEFDGKVTVITGGNAGIGRSCAMTLASLGAFVVIAARNESTGLGTVEAIRQAGGSALFAYVDVRDASSVRDMFAAVAKTPGRLDYLVNSAGVLGDSANTASCSEANWDTVIRTNLTGTWLCMKYALPALLQHRGSAIVNIASIVGTVGFEGLPAYTASKGGVLQLTRTAALEFAPAGLRINAVCPGSIRTAMLDSLIDREPGFESTLVQRHPLGRIGLPEEVAQAVRWLLSENSAFTTGHALTIAGGWEAR